MGKVSWGARLGTTPRGEHSWWANGGLELPKFATEASANAKGSSGAGRPFRQVVRPLGPLIVQTLDRDRASFLHWGEFWRGPQLGAVEHQHPAAWGRAPVLPECEWSPPSATGRHSCSPPQLLERRCVQHAWAFAAAPAPGARTGFLGPSVWTARRGL